MTKYGEEQHRNGNPSPKASYYLLDRDFCVVSAYTCEEKPGSEDIGAAFFDLFPAGAAVRAEIREYVCSYPQRMLLTLCSRTPVLFVGTIYAHTGLVLAVLPHGRIKTALAFPGAFQCVPPRICVSESAQKRYKAIAEHDFSDACRWLLAVSAPFSCAQEGKDSSLSTLLSGCAARLSALLCVPLDCDLSGLAAYGCTGATQALAVGAMLAVLMAAKRSGCADGVRMYGASEGAPTLYLEYSRLDRHKEPCELLPLAACAALRGAVLDAVIPDFDPLRVQVRVCIGTVELSHQGVRERHRFLEGKSPLSILPQAAACALPFPEFPFD